MAQVIGKIGKDAVVKNTSKGDVVEFSIAENFKYKTKSGKVKKTTTWYNCSYWNATNLAPHIKKGVAVIVKGQIDASPYTKNGEPKASLKFTIHDFEFLPNSTSSNGKDEKSQSNQTSTPAEDITTQTVVVDDLPF